MVEFVQKLVTYEKRVGGVCRLPQCDISIAVGGAEFIALRRETDSIYLEEKKKPDLGYFVNESGRMCKEPGEKIA